MTAFHEVEFPAKFALGISGGARFNTEVVITASGSEQRISRWSNPKRSWNAAHAITNLQDLYKVVEFFQARRGMLHGFRFLDPLDNSSASSGAAITPTDQTIDTGDNITNTFRLIKNYGESSYQLSRRITKPITDTVRVAIDGTELAGGEYSVDYSTGQITLLDTVPTPSDGSIVTAGYKFHTPVRFDTDNLVINLSTFQAGNVPEIPIIEIL